MKAAITPTSSFRCVPPPHHRPRKNEGSHLPVWTLAPNNILRPTKLRFSRAELCGLCRVFRSRGLRAMIAGTPLWRAGELDGERDRGGGGGYKPARHIHVLRLRFLSS